MSSKISSIAKNTSYFTLALILQKIVSFSYFTLLARYLGPEDLGKYYFAISFTTIFSIFIDLGLSNVLTREVAKGEDSPLEGGEGDERRAETNAVIPPPGATGVLPSEGRIYSPLEGGEGGDGVRTLRPGSGQATWIPGSPVRPGPQDDRRKEGGAGGDGVSSQSILSSPSAVGDPEKTEQNNRDGRGSRVPSPSADGSGPRMTNNAQELFSTLLGIKLPLTALSLIAVIVLSLVFGYSELVRNLILLSTISMVLDSFTLTFYAFIRGRHNLAYESIGSIVFQLVVLGFGVYALMNDLGLYWQMFALGLGSIVNFTYAYLCLSRYQVSFRPSFDRRLVKAIFAIALPFAIYAVLNRLFTYFDTILLSHYAGDYYVGLYQVAFKIIFALQFLPLAFTASLYPAFAAYWGDYKRQRENSPRPLLSSPSAIGDPLPLSSRTAIRDPEKTEQNNKDGRGSRVPSPPAGGSGPRMTSSRVEDDRGSTPQLLVTFERAMNYIVLISLPIGLGIAAIADRIVPLFGPDYGPAALPLRINMIGLVFLFLTFPLGSLLNATDRQAKNTWNMAIVLTLSLGLNIFLIPRYQAVGASITVACANLLLFVLGLWRVGGVIELRARKLLPVALKCLIAAGIMAISVIYSLPYINLALVIILGGFIYSLIVILSGAVNIADVKSVARSFLKPRST